MRSSRRSTIGHLSRTVRMKIAVIGDIHSAATHFEAALASARRQGFDQLILSGDLWTYGPEPRRTFDLAADAVARDGAVLLLGNHDQMYLAANGGAPAYFEGLPDWIRESVEWSRRELDGYDIDQLAPWRADWQAGELLISHANPYAAGDWSYLSRPEQMEAACTVLTERSFRWGVFGHTHRFRQHSSENGASVITVGSLGQPRDRDDLSSQWAMLDFDGEMLLVEPRHVEIGWDDHCRAIDDTSLTSATKQRLKEFYHQ
jgi:predicted phosphodiesterase